MLETEMCVCRGHVAAAAALKQYDEVDTVFSGANVQTYNAVHNKETQALAPDR